MRDSPEEMRKNFAQVGRNSNSIPSGTDVKRVPANSSDEHTTVCSGCVPRCIEQFNVMISPADTTIFRRFDPG